MCDISLPLLCAITFFISYCHSFTARNPGVLRLRGFHQYFPSFSHKGDNPGVQESSMSLIVEDILFSGDVESVYRRNTKMFSSLQFLSFLQNKLLQLGISEAEEKEILQETIQRVQHILSSTDGMGTDSEIIYEKRLDKIVYSNPGERKNVLEEMKGDLTLGFIQFIETELQNSNDIDIKIALSEILGTIELVKGSHHSAEGILTTAPINSSCVNNDRYQHNFQESVRLGDRNERVISFSSSIQFYFIWDLSLRFLLDCCCPDPTSLQMLSLM